MERFRKMILEDSDTEGNENFYENGDDLLNDLESPLEEENNDPDNDPFMAGDPPLINEDSPQQVKLVAEQL